jgi:hypothetical protein
MDRLIKKLLKESLMLEFYGKKVIEPITKRFNDSSDDMINKLGIAFLFKQFFGDVMQYKTKQEFDEVFDNWYQNMLNSLIKTKSFPENKPLAKKYLDAYINNVVSLGDKARPVSLKNVEASLVDLVNNNRWIKDEEVVVGPTIYEPQQEDVVYEDDNVIVLDTNTKAKCVRYGAGESWCITKPELNYYNTYRLSYGATPYFVLQKNVSGDEHKLVIMNYGGGKYSIADRSNTGSRAGGEAFSKRWSDIERELPNLSGLEKYFPYREITDDEKKYAELLDNIKDNFTDDDLQGFIDSSIENLVVNGSHVSSADFIRDLAANRMYFTNKQIGSLRKESLDSLIEGGYFVNKYYDTYLYVNTLTPAQINRIIKLKMDNDVILDDDFFNHMTKANLKEYLRGRLYANNLNDFMGSMSASKSKLTIGEILKIKELFPDATIRSDRFDITEETGLLKYLIAEPDKITDPELKKHLGLLSSYSIKKLFNHSSNMIKHLVKLDNFKTMNAWDYEEFIKTNPKYYKIILNTITDADVKYNTIRYLTDSGLFPYLVRDGFININNHDDFKDYKFALIHRDKSKSFVIKPELLQYVNSVYDLEQILINQPSLFKYIGDKLDMFDEYNVAHIIVNNPKSLKYIPKNLVDNMSNNRIYNIIYDKPALGKIFGNRLDSYGLRYLIGKKPNVIKYIEPYVLDKIDKWDLVDIIKQNKKIYPLLEPYIDENRPWDKDFILDRIQ